MLVDEYANFLGRDGLAERTTFVPHPIWYTSLESKIEKVYGNDPRSGKPVLESIVEALTRPLTDEETNPQVQPVAEVPRLVPRDTEENLQKLFLEMGWNIDGLPIVLPTEERVQEMLKATSQDPDREFKMRGGHDEYTFTVEKVAANAVMVGATPDMFPLLLCLAAHGAGALSSSTQSFSDFTIVAGPIVDKIKMNYGLGALGPFNQANSVIGRFRNFLRRNLGGGAVPWKDYWGAIGNSLNYNNVTFAENIDALPEGWEPLHVQMGFDPDDNVVIVGSGHGIWHIWNTTSSGGLDSLPMFSEMMLQSVRWNYPHTAFFPPGVLFIIDPATAYILSNREGITSKDQISQMCYENTSLTLEEYWGYNYANNFIWAIEKEIDPYYSYATWPQDTVIPFFASPDQIKVVVTGAGTNPFMQMASARRLRALSVDEWGVVDLDPYR